MSIEIKVKQGKTLSGQEKQSLAMLNAMLERREKLMKERAQKQADKQQGQAQSPQPRQPQQQPEQQMPPANPKP